MEKLSEFESKVRELRKLFDNFEAGIMKILEGMEVSEQDVGNTFEAISEVCDYLRQNNEAYFVNSLALKGAEQLICKESDENNKEVNHIEKLIKDRTLEFSKLKLRLESATGTLKVEGNDKKNDSDASDVDAEIDDTIAA